jgi:hypothetical protein
MFGFRFNVRRYSKERYVFFAMPHIAIDSAGQVCAGLFLTD